jgi:hypothetical protein
MEYLFIYSDKCFEAGKAGHVTKYPDRRGIRRPLSRGISGGAWKGMK